MLIKVLNFYSLTSTWIWIIIRMLLRLLMKLLKIKLTGRNEKKKLFSRSWFKRRITVAQVEQLSKNNFFRKFWPKNMVVGIPPHTWHKFNCSCHILKISWLELSSNDKLSTNYWLNNLNCGLYWKPNSCMYNTESKKKILVIQWHADSFIF